MLNMVQYGKAYTLGREETVMTGVSPGINGSRYEGTNIKIGRFIGLCHDGACCSLGSGDYLLNNICLIHIIGWEVDGVIELSPNCYLPWWGWVLGILLLFHFIFLLTSGLHGKNS
jgi:hypothetical protein